MGVSSSMALKVSDVGDSVRVDSDVGSVWKQLSIKKSLYTYRILAI